MSQYRVYITPEALGDVKNLPGNIRQRIRRTITSLANQPYPSQSKELQYTDPERQLLRIRLGNWRIVYAVTPTENVVDVLAVRKRPPYDYGDLTQLLDKLD